MQRSGTVDTAFTVPTYPVTEDLGSNGVTVTTDTTVTTVNSGAEPAAPGTLYLVNGANHLCIVASPAAGNTGDAVSANRVTGLKINAGVTLTMGLNYDIINADADGNDATGQDEAFFFLSNDLIVNGTLTVTDLTTAGGTVDNRHGLPATNRDKGYLHINSGGDIIVGAAGTIDAAGTDATVAGDRGGDGGTIYLRNFSGLIQIAGTLDNSGGDGMTTGDGGNAAMQSSGASATMNPTQLNTMGTILMTGFVTANGGSGANGGDAGGLLALNTKGSINNTGTVTANGGTGSTGNGGTGGLANLSSSMSGIYNSGSITVNGGDGATGGGSTIYIVFQPASGGFGMGPVYNSGNLSANGGSATTGGSGDPSGWILFRANGGDVRNNGTLSLNGGDGAGAGAAPGGASQYFNCTARPGHDPAVGEPVGSGDILLTGNITLNGGNGASGGNAGYLRLDNQNQDSRVSPSAGYIFLADYSSLDIRGGDGTTTGGNGGTINVQTSNANELSTYIETGSIIIESDILAQGGQGGSATGGFGGSLRFRAQGNAYAGHSGVEIRGDLDVSGGNGAGGGWAGGMNVYGHDFLTVLGNLTAQGGDADSASGNAGLGAAAGIQLNATLQLTNSGTITANGGNGTTGNAAGGGVGFLNSIQLWAGEQVTNTGHILANGGTSSGTANNANGGTIDIRSTGNPAQNSATLEVQAGTGGSGTVGNNGHIYMDGVDVTPVNGVL